MYGRLCAAASHTKENSQPSCQIPQLGIPYAKGTTAGETTNKCR